MGVSIEELRPFILKTLNNVYSCGKSVLKSFSIDTDSSRDDPHVIILETPPTAKRKRPAVDDCASSMLCAAGELCVNIPSTVSDSDPVCPMRDKLHMQFVSLLMMIKRHAWHVMWMKNFEIIGDNNNNNS
jgi:hypothetical protein